MIENVCVLKITDRPALHELIGHFVHCTSTATLSVFLPGEVCKIFAIGPLSKAAHIEAFLTSEVLGIKVFRCSTIIHSTARHLCSEKARTVWHAELPECRHLTSTCDFTAGSRSSL